MDSSNLELRAFLREVREAWTDGCNCELCLGLELVEQGKARTETFEQLWPIWMLRYKHHGDGVWPDGSDRFLISSSNYLRREVGWPLLVLLTPGSGSDRSARPRSHPN